METENEQVHFEEGEPTAKKLKLDDSESIGHNSSSELTIHLPAAANATELEVGKDVKTCDALIEQSSQEVNIGEDNKKNGSKPGSQTEEKSSTESVTMELERDGDDDGASLFQTEKDVGITLYISKHQGFNGILKQRFSDFLVNEINLEGEIVRLKNKSPPAPSPEDDKPPSIDISILKREDIDKLKNLVANNDKKDTAVFEIGDDKEQRTKFHKAVKHLFPKLNSNTEDREGKKVIVVSLKNNKGRDKNQRQEWPKDRGSYTHFAMYKENKDTGHAVQMISKAIHMKPNSYMYAGTKDRRGKTCQQVSVFRVEIAKLAQLNNYLHGVSLGEFSYKAQGLKLGDLRGNHFVVVLRNVTGSDEQIKQGIDSLKDVGFINYFGLQRFGTTAIPTHHVGRALLHSNWQEAVDLIMASRAGENDDVQKAREVWSQTKDPLQALQKLNRRNCIERHLLIGLDKNGEHNLVGALNEIPRNMRTMYVHSYQSYLWNTVVSRRINEFGLKPVVADLVSSVSGLGTKIKPELITEDNLSQYAINDVIIPVPGYDVIYPENGVKEWFQELFTKDGLDIDKLKHKVRDYSLPGSYRYIIQKPENVAYETFQYDDVTIPLCRSDEDIISGCPEPCSVEGGKFKALKLEFSLPSSSYATMAIREILKSDTAAASQALLNVA